MKGESDKECKRLEKKYMQIITKGEKEREINKICAGKQINRKREKESKRDREREREREGERERLRERKREKQRV